MILGTFGGLATKLLWFRNRVPSTLMGTQKWVYMYCHTMSSFELYRTNVGEGSDEARNQPTSKTLYPCAAGEYGHLGACGNRARGAWAAKGDLPLVVRPSARSRWRLPGQREEKEKD